MAPRQSVEYLLVAEFDIDKGPIISHQFPEPLSSDVKQLAELMLPDQTHVRSEDWTVFFLHFSPAGVDRKRAIPTEVLDEPEEPPLMYVLNLVNTKHDKEARRGAQVKALAIVTRHSFLHIYKPILLLALDEYFKEPTEATLATLFDAVNNMDLSAMPYLNQLERLILLQSDREDLFSERFPNFQRDRSNTASSQASSASVGIENLLLETASPALTPTTTRDTHNYITSITYAGTNIPIKVPMTTLPEIVGDFSITQMVNTFSRPATPPTYGLHSSLTTSGASTHPIIVLLNALLTQKRVVFLGQSQPSGIVANHVLAACAMASGGTGLLRSFTERAFPYTDLSKIDDLLTVDGFIAGVTNSIFTLHPEWWDVMANIDSGQVIISSSLKHDGLSPPSPIDSGDVAFMDDLLSSIADNAPEYVIRLKFRDYLLRFTKLAMTYEELKFADSSLTPTGSSSFLIAGHGLVYTDDAQRNRDLAANSARIEAWIGTESHACAVLDKRTQFSKTSNRVRTFDVSHQLDRLRTREDLSVEESGSIYVFLNQEILTDIHMTELLTLMPPSLGGMWVLGQGLFHPRAAARRAMINLLDRVREHVVGKYFYASLSRFYRVAHERLCRDLDREEVNSWAVSPSVRGA